MQSPSISTGIASNRSAAAPGLRWQVWADWPAGGIWSANGVDMSDDVLGLRWEWGRRGLPVPEFAMPAMVELTLRNLDHRYTPSNAGGPLGDGVQPGRNIWLRVGRLWDDFATVGSAPVDLDGRLSADGVNGWEVLTTGNNAFTVLGGEARGTAPSFPPSDAVALLGTGDPLAPLTVRFRRVSNGLGGFALRCAARDDCLLLRFTHEASILERRSGNRTTILATGETLAAQAWHELEIEQTAGGVRVYATNLETSGVAGKEILVSAGIAGAPTSGRHGLWRGFRNVADRWGDFSVGRSLFRGRITAIAPDYAAGVCRIMASDVLQRIEETRLYRALPGGLMRSGNVAAAILGWAGLAPADYAVDGGRLLLTGGPRSVWDVSAGRALRRLQREEHGLIYADGRGRVRLETASVRAGIRGHHDPTMLAKTSLSDTAGGSDPYAANIKWDDGAAAVENPVTFRYRRLADEGPQRVWSLNEPLTLPAGEERLALAATDAWDAIDGVTAPVAGTDYTATDDAAGAGKDVTHDITVAVLSEAESGIAGRGRMLRVRNTGANTAYVQTLRMSASHCWRAEGTTSHRAGDADAAVSGGLVRCRYADHYAAAQAGAEARLAERSRQRPQLEVTLPLAGSANRRAVVEGRISDVVEVQARAQGISGAWLLEGMAVSVGAGGEDEVRWWLTGV